MSDAYGQVNGAGAGGDLHAGDTRDSALHKIRTAGSVSIPPELFEKLYLTPQDAAVRGGLRKTIGNPTPLGLAGFLLSLSPLSCDLMNWRGSAAGNGSSDIAVYLFFGGILMNVAAVFELLLGNTYISVVFGTFGCFWLSYGGTLQPFYGAYGNYSTNPNNPALGLEAPPFNAAFGFFLLFMAVLCFVFVIGALRTNVILLGVLVPLPIAFSLLAAQFWYIADNGGTPTDYSNSLRVAGGAFAFVTCMFGWYLFAALILASLDFPIALPVFDLSQKIKGASEKVEV